MLTTGVAGRPLTPVTARATDRVARACRVIGVTLVLVGLTHVVVDIASPRPWSGPVSWRKPVTFGVSFGIVLITTTWVTSYLRLRPTTRALLLGVLAADSVVEVAGVSLQAWRHVPSHLNTVGRVNASVAYTLAAGGAVLVATLGTFAVTALRGRLDAPPSMRLALQAGFGLLLVGLASGVAMIVRGEVLIHTVGRESAYEHLGFLRWLHAITLHAVLVLPALAWWLGRAADPGRVGRWRRTEAQRHRLVAVAVGVYLLAAAVALVVGIMDAPVP